MPKRLPLYDIAGGLLKSVGKALKYWFHYTLVAIAWLGVVPLTACKLCIKLLILLFTTKIEITQVKIFWFLCFLPVDNFIGNDIGL